MAKKEVTNDQIMTVLAQFATSVDKRFDRIEKRLADHDEEFKKIDENINRIYDIIYAHMTRIERMIEEKTAPKLTSKTECSAGFFS